MKFLFSIITFVFLFSTQVSAYNWSPVPVDVSLSNASVRATVYNSWNRPIVCRGFAYAQFYYGTQARSWMNHLVIYPRTYGYVYVSAFNTYHDPIINGWANIECRWY